MPFITNGLTDSSGTGVTEFLYRHVKSKFEKAGLDISKCSTTRIGNPEDIVEIDGGLWSSKHLNFCSILADVGLRVPLKKNHIVCELGTGLGRNIEIMARLLEEGTFLLFDIPPQLYTANQYLSAIFKDRVIPYREAMEIDVTEPEKALDKIRGKICVLPTWKMPEWSQVKIDLFFNSESFQEMEADVVDNYLSLARRMRPDHIYINAYPDGARWYQSSGLGGGQKSPVSEERYLNCLKADYSLTETYATDKLLRKSDYRSYIFRRNV